MAAICFRHVGPPPENWVFGSDWRAIKLYNYLLCSLISWHPTIWWPTVLVLTVHKTGQPIKLCSSCALSSFGLPHCQVWQVAMVSVLGSLKHSQCTCSWRWPGVRRCCSNWQMGKRYWHKSICWQHSMDLQNVIQAITLQYQFKDSRPCRSSSSSM